MFLKSLTLKGFKSFADKTTLEFEPGVCVVVGPNGSGKSNIVDSVAWVLGAQGARALRGGKMDDVIFAGTAQRQALGRAEVSLTIDNTAQLLPIEFTEVTITRTLFRTGESEYAINGAPCRLLDIQELLSDSGIGRQQHVIVGQGQIDAVLNARPEDRRAVIEEAAGILKYRKRKEKAQRRLEATEASLMRLSDLLREVRRQLRPLEKQADAARRHGEIAESLRAVRLHLSGREIESLQSRTERRRAERAQLAGRESELRGRLRTLDADTLEAERALALPGDDDVADLLLRVEGARERARGLQALIAERLRNIERELERAADEGVVETLVADAAALRAELADAESDFALLAPGREEVDAAEQRVEELRRAIDEAGGAAPEMLPEAQQRRAAEAALEAAAAEWRDAQAALSALESRAGALSADEPAVRAELEEVTAALGAFEPERAELTRLSEALGERRAEFDTLVAGATGGAGPERARLDAERVHDEAVGRQRAAEAEASRWRARAETLALALAEAHAAAGGEAIAGISGIAGPLLDHLRIEPGAEAAVAAALGDAVHAIVAESPASARSAVERLKHAQANASLLVAGAPRVSATSYVQVAGARRLTEVVRCERPDLEQAVHVLLANAVLVSSGWQAALDIALGHPDLTVVTPEGDRFGGHQPWRAGPAGRSAVTAAALAEAEEQAERAEAAAAEALAATEAARVRRAEAQRAEQAARAEQERRRSELEREEQAVAARLRNLEVARAGLEDRSTSLSERLVVLAQRMEGLPAEREITQARVAECEAGLEVARASLAAARRAELATDQRLRAQRSELERLRAGAAKLRREYEVRGAEIQQRRLLLSRRLEDTERRLAARPDEEAEAKRRRAQLTSRQEAVLALRDQLGGILAEADTLAERLRERRRRQSDAAREAGARLDALRTERSGAERALAETRERQQRLELEEVESRTRLEQAVETIRREFDCEPEAAIAAPAPEVPEGTSLAQRGRELERELRLLGPINPLALSEYEALVERHEFLQQQLDDVKHSRRELSRVIKAVNEEIVAVFEQAFGDVAANFEQLFATLFPGGSGRLVLTDPADLLDTGIDIEARPSGKTPRRLSLLSGGERTLTAMAYLFAVFRARPSPFYLLDEVEAALDDVNLHRFLDLLAQFRGEAQLLVVSHQKRTMEAADVLYGVSMPPGGSSVVVSQRIRDLTLEDASVPAS